MDVRTSTSRLLAMCIVFGAVHFARADAKAEVQKAADAYDKAIAANDAKGLEAVFDDDGHFVDERGVEFDKKGYLAAYVNDNRKWETAGSTKRSFRVISDSLVIESGTFLGTGTADGKPFKLHSRYVDIWIKKDGRWVVTEELATPIAEDAK
jgi:ketosteroid isomerase-like protein